LNRENVLEMHLSLFGRRKGGKREKEEEEEEGKKKWR